MRAEDAVKLITEPLETIVKGIDGVEHVYSQTSDDRVMVTARFLVGTPSDAAILRVHDKVRANIDRIPVGIPEPLIVGRGIDDVAIVSLTLAPKPERPAASPPTTSPASPASFRTEIAKIHDVGLTYIVGETSERMRIAPDPERLALYGVTLQQLAGKVTGANTAFPTGQVRDKGEQIMLVAGETLRSPDEIGNLLLTTRDGRPVYVRDVADVSFAPDGEEQLVATVSKAEGGTDRVPAVTLAVAKRAGSNAVIVAEEILHRAHALEGTLIPEEIAVEVTRDYGESANEKANELLFHLGLATVSIVVLVWVAIGRREALVVAIVIPVTILLTLFASNLMGYTLNRVSLFALIFSIGILVDDAIVVIENIARHWGMGDGRDRRTAAIDAVAEVGNPTIVATLTVVAALLPMLFVSGLMGPYMSPIPANASAAMIFSFFVAVMVTPWLMLKVAGKATVAHGHDDAGGHRRRARPRLSRPSPGRSSPRRREAGLFLAIVVVLTIGSLALFYTKHVTVKLLPFDNKSELSVIIDLPEGSSVEATDAVAQAVANVVLDLPEVRSVQTHAGTAAPFNFNGLVRHSYLRASPEMGDVAINLLPKGDRDRTSHEIALEIRERIMALPVPAGTSLKVVEPPPGPPVLATLLAEIYGPDAETRRAVAAKVEEAFRSVPFIVDVDNSYGEPGPAPAHHRLDRRGGVLPGPGRRRLRHDRHPQRRLDHRLFASRRGAPADPDPHRAAEGRAHVRRALPDDADARQRAAGRARRRRAWRRGRGQGGARLLPGLPPQRPRGRDGDGGACRRFRGAALRHARRAGGDRRAGLDRPAEARDLAARPAGRRDGADLLWDGEWEVTWVTFRDMGAAFGIALLGIYILVVAQFGSFKVPLVILTPIPLTFIGILGGHWVFGAPFSATSMIGFIALAGIIVRNSILLVDFIRHAKRPDRPLTEVLIEAGAIRFKPILLTALAAMIGAAVILTDPIFQGLAISLLFGLASSTLLTVLVIPAVYRVLRT